MRVNWLNQIRKIVQSAKLVLCCSYKSKKKKRNEKQERKSEVYCQNQSRITSCIQDYKKEKKISKVSVHYYFLKFLNLLILGNLFRPSSEQFLVLSSIGERLSWSLCFYLGNILGNPLGGSLRRVDCVTLLRFHLVAIVLNKHPKLPWVCLNRKSELDLVLAS